jgi:hypothetical protein
MNFGVKIMSKSSRNHAKIIRIVPKSGSKIIAKLRSYLTKIQSGAEHAHSKTLPRGSNGKG